MKKNLPLIIVILLLPISSFAGILYNNICYTDFQKFRTVYYSTVLPLYIPNSDFSFDVINWSIDSTDTTMTLTENLLTNPPKNTIQATVTHNKYDSNSVFLSSKSQLTKFRLPWCTIDKAAEQPVNLNITYPTDTFNPSNINPVDAASSIGSGFLLIAVPLAVVWAGRQFLRPLLKI